MAVAHKLSYSAVVRRLFSWAALAAAAVTVLASAGLGTGTAQAASACPGRLLLQCSERTAAFNDFVTWNNAFVLDLEIFETSVPLPLYNPALGAFWRFETSTAAARAIYEFELLTELGDQNFEQVATVPVLPRPIVHPHKVVDARTARALSSLMRNEQSEVLHLEALVTALNRATEATYLRGRSDWVAWQLASAAGFASQTANDIGRVIVSQRSATAALTRRHLLFGIGSEDLKLAQRNVRQHGIAPSIRATMAPFGLADPSILSKLTGAFLQASFGSLSFSLSQFFSISTAIAGERTFQAALRHFAARIPPASPPPS